MELDRTRIRRESRERDREFGAQGYPWRVFVTGAIAAALVFAWWWAR